MSETHRTDTLRQLSNEEAAGLPGWLDPYFVQAIAIVAAKRVGPWGPEVAMPNGETATAGMMVVADRETRDPRYCLPYAEFMDGHDTLGDGLYQPKPVSIPMLLVSAPFVLHAPEAWTGHEPWTVDRKIHLTWSGVVFGGYPILKTPQGDCHADPALWEGGHYKMTGIPAGRRPA